MAPAATTALKDQWRRNPTPSFGLPALAQNAIASVQALGSKEKYAASTQAKFALTKCPGGAAIGPARRNLNSPQAPPEEFGPP